MSAIVKSTLVGIDLTTLLTTRQESVTLTFEGVAGDNHTGYTRGADGRTPWYPRGTQIRNDRQVSLVSMEELAEVADKMNIPEIKPEWLGANILVAGIPGFSMLPWRTRLVFSSGAVLSNLHENNPCTGPAKLIAQAYNQPELASLFPKAAMHLRGIVATVEFPGEIRVGDEIQAISKG